MKAIKCVKQSNLIIVINACTKLIDLFLGPFLVAYFIKTSMDSMVDLSIVKLMEYFFLGLFGVLLGYIIKRNHALAIFRLGVIARLIYILVIIVLQSEIINYLGLIAFLHGFSAALFWLPFNIYMAKCVENCERTAFEVNKKIVSTIIAVSGPLLLGALITSTNYISTAVYILLISAAQIACSFFLRNLPVTDTTFNMRAAIKRFSKVPQLRKSMLACFLEGMTLSAGPLAVIVTILIMSSFSTNFDLGVINSAAAIAGVVVCYIYSKFFKKSRWDKPIALASSLITVAATLLLCLTVSEASVATYTILLEAFGVGLLSMLLAVRVYNVSNTLVEREDTTEYWSLREVMLNIGRLVSFSVLLVIGLVAPEHLMTFLLVLSVFIVILGYVTARIDRND
ncbi:MAG: hypothetical protein LBL08_02180 [Candidatus Nomurabacteria bacterium]|jgi:hypothetical protein|nr:hypothetical protein [Candidatus Nomurabacteria bacterium]